MRKAKIPREVLATRRNMEKYARESWTTPSGAIIMPQQPIAYSPMTGETCSATSGDYFMRGMDDPLLDSEGEPMILAFERHSFEHIVEVEK